MPSRKSQVAFQFSVEMFNASLYMWTFTWPEVQDVSMARKRWGKFLSGGSSRARTLMNAFPAIGGLRVFEMHPGREILGERLSHGLHVHALIDQRLPVDIVRSLWEHHGGGRLHVVRVPREKALYVGKYLCKQRVECLKGVRLWAPFGRCEASKVKNIKVESSWTLAYHFLAVSIGGFKSMRWDQRARMTTAFVDCRDIQLAFAQIGFRPDIEDEFPDVEESSVV